MLRDDVERLGRFDPVRVRQRMRDGFSRPNTRVITADAKDVGSVSVRQESTATPLRLNVLRGSSARRLYERHGFVVDYEDDVDVVMTYRR